MPPPISEHGAPLDPPRRRAARERARHRVGALAAVLAGVVGGRLPEELLLAVARAAAGHRRRPKWPRETIDMTVTPSWFTISPRILTVPRSDRAPTESSRARSAGLRACHRGARARASAAPRRPRSRGPRCRRAGAHVEAHPQRAGVPAARDQAAEDGLGRGLGVDVEGARSHCRAKSTISCSVTV